MSNCVDYNCDPLLDHVLNPLCGEELQGGAKHAVFLDCDHQLTDPSSNAQIQAEVAAGRAKLVKNLTIDIPKGSPVKVDSQIACAPQKLVMVERTVNIIDGNVSSDNIDFWNTLNKRSIGGMIIQECGTDQTTWIDAEIKFEADRILPKTNKEFQRFEAVGSWLSLDMPQIYASPVGTFA